MCHSDFLRLTLIAAMHFVILNRKGRYTPAQEADAYLALLDASHDAVSWTGEKAA